MSLKFKSGQQVKSAILVKVNNSQRCPNQSMFICQISAKKFEPSTRKIKLFCWSNSSQNNPKRYLQNLSKSKSTLRSSSNFRSAINQGQSAQKTLLSLPKNSTSKTNAKSQVKSSQTNPKLPKVNVG